MIIAKPLVSVIMPVYNTEKYLDAAVSSILNQTYSHFELIIVDDGSTDSSLKIIKKYQQKDSRIAILVHKQNLGVTESRNEAIEKAGGIYVAIMGSDDISLKNRIEKQVGFLEENKKCQLLGSHIIFIDESGKETGFRKYPITCDAICAVIGRYNPFAEPSVMIRKLVFESVGKYVKKYGVSEEYDLWFRIASKYEVNNLDEFLVKYRIHNKQIKYRYLKKSLLASLDTQRRWIFHKKFFSLAGLVSYVLKLFLFLLPSRFIHFVFRKIRISG